MKKKTLLMLAAILTCGLVLTSCTDDENAAFKPTDEVEAQLQQLTLREKIGMMFFARMESLDSTIKWTSYADLQENPMTELTNNIRNTNKDYPVGGIILYAWNIQDEPQLTSLISDIRALNGQPLLCIDEEGGRIARIANNPNFNVEVISPMSEIGNTGDPANAYHAGNVIGKYLTKYGFDIDFAPVADVNTNPDNI